jgi:hypothetical protein
VWVERRRDEVVGEEESSVLLFKLAASLGVAVYVSSWLRNVRHDRGRYTRRRTEIIRVVSGRQLRLQEGSFMINFGENITGCSADS